MTTQPPTPLDAARFAVVARAARRKARRTRRPRDFAAADRAERRFDEVVGQVFTAAQLAMFTGDSQRTMF